MRLFVAIFFVTTVFSVNTQTYTSYVTGNATDIETQSLGGVCMMGGASENDDAMKWFLERANGGDVLVLRASGSDGYNDYFFADLGVTVNSVETIVCHSPACADETYIQEKIRLAEAIWFAGGDQWNYISYWRNTKIDSLINDGLSNRNIVIGGTSAGMAIQGGFYFSAQNGTVSSNTALMNPFDATVTVDSISFLKNEWLHDVIMDTHFDNPNRKGRLSVFMARISADYEVRAKAIACDEYTAVCIDENGYARVFGEYPAEDDNAYFVQVNCSPIDNLPQVLEESSPLTWNNADALKVYKVSGTSAGENGFDLADWSTGNGGQWLHWSVNNGVFQEVNGSQVVCNESLTLDERSTEHIQLYPNPGNGFYIAGNEQISALEIYDYSGKLLHVEAYSFDKAFLVDNYYSSGLYTVVLRTNNNELVKLKWVKY